MPAVGAGLLAAALSSPVQALVPLQNATATYSQTNPSDPSLWIPAKTIDGMPYGAFTSWAIYELPGIQAQTIVWETQSDFTSGGAPNLRFNLYHGDYVPSLTHYLGRFRLSYTTDDRALFADGLANGGDVSADWTVIAPASVSSSGGDAFAILPDQSILLTTLVSTPGTHPTYTVEASVASSAITGFRLEAMKDASLPFGGPGLDPTAGNFHLSEFEVSLVPEPAAFALWTAGLAFVVRCVRPRRVQAFCPARVPHG
jgi:hypothetical protein